MKGTTVKKFVIIMTCENGDVEVYEEYDKSKYIRLLTEYIREFVQFKIQEYAKAEEENLNDLLRSKFFSPSRFSEEIEKVVLENPSMGYMDAIVFFWNNNNIDIESVPKLISKPSERED